MVALSAFSVFEMRLLAEQIHLLDHRHLQQVALDDFRLDVHSSLGVPWDGGTEWFHLECFMHAVDLLQRLPKGRTQETLRLQRLDGDAVDESLYLWKTRGDERLLRREAVARENVIRMRQIWTAFQAWGKRSAKPTAPRCCG